MSAVAEDIVTGSAEAGSVFSMHSATLVNLGFSPIPIVAGEKRPAISVWQRHCDHSATSDELARYTRIPGAGIGVALGSRVGASQIVAVDLDVDGADLDRLIAALPESPMKKRGAKGETLYYLADPALKTTRYRAEGGRGIADLQAHGTQTVLPPSRHPSGVPYVWTAGPTRADMLPILTEIDLARFEAACKALSWQEAVEATGVAERAAANADGAPQARGEANGFCRELNDIALENLDAWVPFLTGLYGTRRKPGGYEGVPLFRPSGENNPPERRKRNLSITASGISDWGDGQKGYTPINLVIASEGIDLGAAIQWLKERVMPVVDGHEFDAVTASNGASARQANALPPHDPVTGEIIPADVCAASALVWDDQEANAALETKWLIKKLLPDRGVALLWGASGSSKSFVTLELAACVITGHPFFGLKTKLSGGVLFALGEAAGTMPARMNGLRQWRIDGMTQNESFRALNLKKLPVTWLPVGNLVQPAKMAAFKAEIRNAAAGMLERHACPLRLVFVDTAVASFGFADDPDATAVQSMMKQLAEISQEMDLCFVVVHHAGKTKEAGAHGSYAWTGASDSVIFVEGTKDALLGTWSDRRLILQKEKNGGNEGWNRPFELRSVVLGIDDDDENVTSAIVMPSSPAALEGVTSGGGHAGHPAGVARILNALIGSMASGAQAINVSDDETMQAVKIDDVRTEYAAAHPSEHARRNFNRDLGKAVDARLVAKRNIGGIEWLWPTASNDNNPPTD